MGDHEEDRVATLELRFMEQSRLIEELSEQMVEANKIIERLVLRVGRLEEGTREILDQVRIIPSEKPPHY
ncbi:MAG: hypothetical protein HC927_04920 [Deltaproteobacteria bacterium]|nr:hypothetical protein [Deltaproteobacteria bacterium]